MVKKLLKYEFKARAPLLLLFWGIILLLACAVKIMSLLNNSDNGFNPVSFFYRTSVTLLAMGCSALLVVTEVLNIVRFYKNLYSTEGYLSFTLPVTEHQHIFVKTFVSFVMIVGGFIVCCIAALIAADADFIRTVFVYIEAMFEQLVDICGTVNVVFYVIEGVIAIIIALLTGIMVFNACLSIGQLAKRRKVLLAVGVYAGLHVASQILSTILTVILAFSANFLEDFFVWFSEHLAVGLHVSMSIILVIDAAAFVLFYLATYLPMKKRLNLE